MLAVAPVCKPGQQKVHGVARQETVRIQCELEANPQEGIHFTWKFNNTAEIIDIAASYFTTDRARSTTSYTPMTELDYGTLLCWGRNDLGVQKAPCVFHIIPAGMLTLILNSGAWGINIAPKSFKACAPLLPLMIFSATALLDNLLRLFRSHINGCRMPVPAPLIYSVLYKEKQTTDYLI